jgi:hypothetical protein
MVAILQILGVKKMGKEKGDLWKKNIFWLQYAFLTILKII